MCSIAYRFARHLVKEWCLENLLFLIESQQWIDALLAKSEYNGIDHGGLSLKFCADAPKSRISVTKYSDEAMENEYLQCIKLFEKYVSNSGQFCLNLDYRSRAKLYLEFGAHDGGNVQNGVDMLKFMKEKNISREELVKIFDHARRDVYGLLVQSFYRYQLSEEYKLIEDELNIDVHRINSKDFVRVS